MILLAQNPQQHLCQMSDERSDESRDNFAYFSGEYAQALQALKAIEDQSSTLMLLGNSDDLRTFIDQFIEMASRVRSAAEERNEPNFVEWFNELIKKAETLRTEIVRQ
jgi:prephenate dehydrogenase